MRLYIKAYAFIYMIIGSSVFGTGSSVQGTGSSVQGTKSSVQGTGSSVEGIGPVSKELGRVYRAIQCQYISQNHLSFFSLSPFGNGLFSFFSGQCFC